MANTSSSPNGILYYSSTQNEAKAHPNLNFVYDVNHVRPGSPPSTGGWRALVPSDLAGDISLSGVSISIGAVAVTGTVHVTGNFGGGGASDIILTSGFKAVSTNFAIITGSQLVIPANSRSWSIGFISGDYGVIDGIGTFPAGVSFSSQNYNLNPIVVGGTGNVGAPFKAIVQWEN